MIDVIIPSYGRADRIAARVDNCLTNSDGEVYVHVVVEKEEVAEYDAALRHTGAYLLVNNRKRSYAGAVNTAVALTFNYYLFLAADDLVFSHGWVAEAVETMEALPHLRVVGTNDLLNGYVLNGWHATHYLIDRRYIEDVGGVIDEAPGTVLYEGYDHNYTDTEFIGTAKARAVFAPCLTSVVKHEHFSVTHVNDATVAKTVAKLDQDAELYNTRKHLWWELSK